MWAVAGRYFDGENRDDKTMHFTAYNVSLFFTKSEDSIPARISTMSALAAGNYVIYNHATTVTGEKLVITFHDIKTPPTMEKLGSVSEYSQTVCSPPSLLSLCLLSRDSIDYNRYLQWRVDDFGIEGLRTIVPLKDETLQACWGDDQSVIVALATCVWIITEADTGYTYVTSTSWLHFPSSFPLLVSWMGKALLSGVLPRACQTRR